MTRKFKRIAVLLVFTLIAPSVLNLIPMINSLTVKEVSAATNAALEPTEYTLGINSSPQYIGISDATYNAVYSYQSADSQIVEVSSFGSLTGIAKGKTNVTVMETVNGATTDLGNVSVKVVAPKLAKSMVVGYENTASVPIEYFNNGATYQYKTSNEKIATVDQYGWVKGVKFGKAKITVTETYKKKTTKLGTITVSVVKASIADKKIELGVRSDSYYLRIDNRNMNASYKIKSSNSKIVKIDEYGYAMGLKKGKAKIQVTETYNKKTRNVGSITVNVVGVSINKDSSSVSIGINSINYIPNFISFKNVNYEAYFTCESADSSIVATENFTENSDYTDLQVKGVGLGKTTLTIYENFNNKKEKIGTVEVSVIEIPLKNLSFDTYETYQVNGINTKDYYLDQVYGYSLKDLLIKEPYNATFTSLTFSSSDEKVIKVDNNGYFTLVGEGTATITITSGEFTVKFNACVKAHQDFY